MKQLLKFISILSLIFTFTLISAIRSSYHSNPLKFRQRNKRLHQKFCVWALSVLGIRLSRLQPNGLDLAQNYFVVSNHLSYIDVLIINSVLPTCFVTSQEIRETLGLGYLAEVAGCIFVERRHKLKIGEEINELSRALDWGLNVCVFPEATSTNGEQVLPFKRPLFQASVNARVPVLPITINYSIDGKQLMLANRDLVCWYGDMDFLPHLWNTCGADRISCRLDIHTPIEIPDGTNIATLSEFARDRVVSAYKPILQNAPNAMPIFT